MSIPFGARDYLVVEIDGKRIIGTAVGKRLLSVSGQDEEVRFEPGQVIANIGKDPDAGASVFGARVDRMYDVLELPALKVPMEIRRRIDAAALADVRKDCVAVLKWLNDNKLRGALNAIKTVQLVKVSKQGYDYKKRFVNKETSDILTLASDTAMHGISFAEAIGAHLWEYHVPTRKQVAWLKLLHKQRRVVTCNNDDLISLLETYTASNEPDLKSLHDLAEMDNGSLVVRTIVAHMRKVHGLSCADVDMLCRENKDMVGEIWPEWTTFVEQRPEFPPHAMKSPRNLFAYAFSCYLRGEKAVPQSLRKPIEVTIAGFERQHLDT